MQSQLEGVGMKLQTIKTSRSVAEHMKGISMVRWSIECENKRDLY